MLAGTRKSRSEFDPSAGWQKATWKVKSSGQIPTFCNGNKIFSKEHGCARFSQEFARRVWNPERTFATINALGKIISHGMWNKIAFFLPLFFVLGQQPPVLPLVLPPADSSRWKSSNFLPQNSTLNSHYGAIDFSYEQNLFLICEVSGMLVLITKGRPVADNVAILAPLWIATSWPAKLPRIPGQAMDDS